MQLKTDHLTKINNKSSNTNVPKVTTTPPSTKATKGDRALQRRSGAGATIVCPPAK